MTTSTRAPEGANAPEAPAPGTDLDTVSSTPTGVESTEPLTGEVAEVDISAVQQVAASAVEAADLQFRAATTDGERKAAKAAMTLALVGARSSVRIDALDLEDEIEAERKEFEESIADRAKVVAEFKSTTLHIVGLAAFSMSASDIARDLFGMVGAVKASKENEALVTRVTRLANNGMVLEAGKQAKGGDLTPTEAKALTKGLAQAGLAATRTKALGIKSTEDLDEAVGRTVRTPAMIAAKAVERLETTIDAVESAMTNLAKVAGGLTSDHAEALAKVLAEVENLQAIWAVEAPKAMEAIEANAPKPVDEADEADQDAQAS